MTHETRWKQIEEIGSGGQGKVFRVCDAAEIGTSEQLQKDFSYALSRVSVAVPNPSTVKEDFELLSKCIIKVGAIADVSRSYALKILHNPSDARDAALAERRIENEIEAMSKVDHPNLLRIVDHDTSSKWFVSPYYSGGTLASKLGHFSGDVVKALKALRPIVSGVAELHKQKIVHRDIKPQNVFMDIGNNLVLGDFGLCFIPTHRTAEFHSPTKMLEVVTTCRGGRWESR